MKCMTLAVTALTCSLLAACGGSTSPDQLLPAASTALRPHISINSPEVLQGTTGIVYRMYQTALGRAPDPQGLDNWAALLASGAASPVTVAAGFYNSSEFQQRYGALTNAQFVQQLYRNVLGREPDSQGFAFHVQNLDSGKTDRPNTLVAFSESPENTLRAALTFGVTSTTDPGPPPPGLPPDGMHTPPPVLPP